MSEHSMGDEHERRADSVSISRQTASTFTKLAVTLVTGVVIVFWGLIIESVRHNEHFKHLDAAVAKLQSFADRGERFTPTDAKLLREEFRTAALGQSLRLTQLEVWQLEHESWGKQKTGEWESLHREFNRRFERLEGAINGSDHDHPTR